MSHRITFQPSGLRSDAEEGETLLDASLKAGEDVESTCAGSGICGKCAVLVRSGETSPETTEELNVLSPERLSEGYRLSCMAVPRSDCTVEVPESSRRRRQVVLGGDSKRTFRLFPAARRFYVDAGAPMENAPVPDAERVIRAAGKTHGLEGLTFGIRALRSLPGALRAGNNSVTLTVLDGRDIVRVTPGYGGALYGAAVDFGSTTVAACLCDMESGEVISEASSQNPQISMGEDVMRRIGHAAAGGADKLKDAAVFALDGIVEELCQSAPGGVSPDDIVEVSVVGNTAMFHLLLGLDVSALGVYPFTPALAGPVAVDGGQAGIGMLENARIYFPPAVGGFVGSDLVAAAMATGDTGPAETVLLADLGTNGELALFSGGEVAVASCATGPAFEGAHIEHGMRASEGAIERVVIDPDTGEVSLKVIGFAGWSRPGRAAGVRGVCGSGVVDAVAQMHAAGIIDESGKFINAGGPARLAKSEDGAVGFVLATGNETVSGRAVSITQSDIRAVQLAKAAIASGVGILMSRLSVNSIDRVLLAGAFGNYIDPKGAWELGMFPGTGPSSVSSIGNAALDGARALLLGSDSRAQAALFASSAIHVELSTDSSFQERFMDAMSFPAYG